MFYDEVKVSLKAGDGGDGCFSFRRAKYEPKGGPDGGNGGRGGSVFILADTNVADLTDYHFKPIWKAKNGEPGRGSDQHGARGNNLTIKLPVGTVVIDRETESVVAEVLEHGDEVLLLEGGTGARETENLSPLQTELRENLPWVRLVSGASFYLLLKRLPMLGWSVFPMQGNRRS